MPEEDFHLSNGSEQVAQKKGRAGGTHSTFGGRQVTDDREGTANKSLQVSRDCESLKLRATARPPVGRPARDADGRVTLVETSVVGGSSAHL